MRIWRTMAISCVLGMTLFLAAPEAQAQVARISGMIVDPDQKPLAGVTVTVTTPDSERFELVKTTNKKGKVTLSFNNLEWKYEIRLEKEGFQTMAEPLQLAAGGTVSAQWVLVPDMAASSEGASAGGATGGGSRVVQTFNEGVEAQRIGDLDLATEKFREAAEINPGIAAPHTALAAVAAIREDWETAAAEAESALAIDPEDVRAMELRFDAYRKLGNDAKASEAAADLREAGHLDSAAARLFNEGVDAYNAGDVATAQSKFRQTIELAPELVPPYMALAKISLSQGSAAEALAMAQSALEREPENPQALMIAYDGARLTGDQETAGHMLDRLLEVDPQWITTKLYGHSVELFDNNQPEAAAFELQYVVKADPNMARAHYMLGMALFNSGRAEEGRAHLEKFIELAPDDPDVEIAKGLISYRQ